MNHRRDNDQVQGGNRRCPLVSARVLAALLLWLGLTLASSCRADDGSREVVISARPAWIPADGHSTLILEISSDSVPPLLKPSLGRIVALERRGGDRWLATLQAGNTIGRVTFIAAAADLRESEPVYFIPPPEPGSPPACARDTLATYTLIFDRATATAVLDAPPTDNFFASAVHVFLHPDAPPVFSGDTVTIPVLVEGTSVDTDLFDVRLTVDAVAGAALPNPGSTADGETFFDFGDFPATAAATRDEGGPALWFQYFVVSLDDDEAMVQGRITAASACPQSDAAFRIRPYLTHKGPDRIGLRWETDREAPDFAAFGGHDCTRVAGGTPTRRRIYDNYDGSFPRRFTSFFHAIELGGLAPGDTVWYRVPAVADPVGPEPFTFDTRPGRTFTFGVIGDTQIYPYYFTHMAGLVGQAGTDFYLHVGDLAQRTWLEEEWLAFFTSEESPMRNQPFFPAPGNHDQICFDVFFNRYFSSGHWYSLDWGNSHFIFLDSYQAVSPGSMQHQWLSADLAATALRPEIRFTFVTIHNPIWTIFPYSFYSDSQYLEPLFEAYGVDAVFTGHIHLYERSDVNGRIYIDTSGGGAPLRAPVKNPAQNPYYVHSDPVYNYLTVTVEADRFTIRAFNWDNQIFDQVERVAQ